MKPKAIILDLDGTLLNSNKQISQRNLNAIHAVKAHGVMIIFATARPPRVVNFGDIDLFSFGSVVFYNGALFRCPVTSEDIHFSISKELVRRVVEHCLSLDSDSSISIEVKDKWYSYKLLDYTEMMKVKMNPQIINIEEVLNYDCTKILITDFDFSDDLIRRFNSELNILVTDQGRLIQIMSNNASKESAIKYITNLFGINMDDVMCFGDDFNDLGLFQMCGYSVAMGNATTELKVLASEITESNDKDGVAIILERLVKQSSVK